MFKKKSFKEILFIHPKLLRDLQSDRNQRGVQCRSDGGSRPEGGRGSRAPPPANTPALCSWQAFRLCSRLANGISWPEPLLVPVRDIRPPACQAEGSPSTGQGGSSFIRIRLHP
ncbi:hypothetical protein KGM_215379 [Danaus plexippus plexippus]|uniref:Uncharacterized protein n=1 Tax=Danaus plexippus plexippus TaxID=278856 RepID=A0A212F8L6_DANPL|nr:hypothetical protein KGM_215379 [Danaus plexippus plexippus]